DDIVGIVRGESLVREVRVSVDGGTSFDMLPHFGLKMALLPTRQHGEPDLADAVLAVAVEQAHDGHLARHRPTLRDAKPSALALMHVPRFAADESLVDFHIAAEFPAVLGLEREPQTRQHE